MKLLVLAFVRMAPRALAPLLGSLLVQVPAAQLFGPQEIISTDVVVAQSVFAADLDGDGDQDVLSSSLAPFSSAKLVWYENTDGLGSFGPQRIISAVEWHDRFFVGDLDGDGDHDVLATGNDKIVWYENTDGLGAFGPQLIITTDVDSPVSVFAVDLDGDGDRDVLSTSLFDDKLAWYENTDGLGAFGPQQIISSAAKEPFAVIAADLDGDGDQDVLSSFKGDGTIAWYENTDGLGAFGPQQIITAVADGAFSVVAADLDGDGDQDVLSASSWDDKLAWYENTDGLGSFGPQLIIDTPGEPIAVFASDLDGDGDQDVLASATNPNRIVWYENTDGLGAFGQQLIITILVLEPGGVHTADLDGDGDQDILSASWNKIAWYEHLASPWGILPYGCGVNPAGSLTVLSGAPSIGTTVAFGIDNPLGTQGAPAASFLALCTAPDPAFPCGTLLPGFGMAGPGAVGELLVNVLYPNWLHVFQGPSWLGAGTPASISVDIPPNVGLLGLEAWFQGFILDSLPDAPVPFGLTTGIVLKITT